jgi:hypothetical protein
LRDGEAVLEHQRLPQPKQTVGRQWALGWW